MPCLICKYWQPTEPPQHKADREANACQSYCGKKWDHCTAIRYVKSHGALQGWCRLHPEPLPVAHSHICGDIKTFDFVHNAYWGVPRWGEDFHDETLFEWAGRALTVLKHGTGTERRNDQLEEENTELRRQLKASRKISASRLARLQKQKPEPQPEQKELDPLPKYPRLVAAE